VSPAEREGPSEAAVREQLREEPGPRASSAPAQAREVGGDADRRAGEEVDRGPAEQGGEGGFADAAGDAAVTEPGGADEPGSDAPVDASLDPLAEAELRRDEYLELAQRTQADFENFRRRAARDAATAGARAKAGLVRELLPAIDNLERALAASDHADDGFARGVQMVHGELVGALERSGVAAFEPYGEPFDPTVHEAISTRPADGTEAGVVLDVVEKGYRLDETVVRPARVVVSA
jgi:molecular chaperone GrpE